MYFKGKISVQVTLQSGQNVALQTVIAVRTHDESKNIGADCEVEVPLNCRIEYLAYPGTYLTDYPQNIFQVGDPIAILAGYEGEQWIKVFEGFIWDFVEGNPMKIKILDYIYYLQQGLINIQHANISLQSLIQQILPPQVSLILPTIEFNLVDISFVQMSAYAILRYLKEKLGLNISLIGNQLYVNIASNTTSTVYFDTGVNVMRADLQSPQSIYRTFKIIAHFENENGTENKLEIGDPNGILKECWFYKVQQNLTLYNQLAQGFLYQCKQEHYSGYLTTWLYPDVQLFQRAIYNDRRYPARSGTYVITQNNVTLDSKGFHRKIKLSYLAS